jgi:opacity protein-like surface antigen
MTRCLILSGFAYALLACIPSQAQVSSSGAEAPPNAKKLVGKSESPIPAARKPVFVPTGLDLKASVGYLFTNSGMPSASRLNLAGVDAGFIADLSPFFGLTGNSSYVHAADVFGTNNHADIFSYLVGPVLYPVRHGRVRAYVQVLAGGARVAGAIPSSSASTLTGYVNKFSWAVGGGVEYQISPLVALRTGSDYQHTFFYDPNIQIRGQNDFRAVCSLVLSVWQHPRRRF